MNCIFCKIAAGELQSWTLYEDEYTVAFLDLAQDVDGHILVIPKKHAETIMDCDAETLTHVMNTVKLVARHCVEDCGYSGVNLLHASGTAAGQSVPHFHIHVIPREDNDGVDAWPNFLGAKKPVEELYRKLKLVRDGR